MTDTSINTLTQRLIDLSRALSAGQTELTEAEQAAVQAGHRADLAEARAFLTADGSVEVRKRQAFLDSEQYRLDAEVAEAGVKAARSRMATLRAQIDVGRTLLSSAKAEMQAFPGTGAA